MKVLPHERDPSRPAEKSPSPKSAGTHSVETGYPRVLADRCVHAAGIIGPPRLTAPRSIVPRLLLMDLLSIPSRTFP